MADVNNNPDNPIINIRSFGEDPQAVAAHVKAFIEGAHADQRDFVLATAKHFPGHGDTSTDTHMSLAAIRPTANGWSVWNWCPSGRPSRPAWTPS